MNKFFTGLGYWTRANPEMCLLATKGNPKRISKNVNQLVIDKRREHSRKPDCVRDRIVELMGDLPRIELFARQKVDGWDCWGNEI
jgi:N6-adenosine-specific RNA methylase IME4